MIIKCKMCGGDLNFVEGEHVCECEFCGTKQTIPTMDNEKKTNMFNRANRLRINAEFDKAMVVYASITAEFPDEAEAYWGLCLCKYGIEYVDDPRTGQKIPTCHRTLPVSIMNDDDFVQACECADVVSKRIYREEAKKIDRLQQNIHEIVANEQPYDVFICYKELDTDGTRTEDSVLAQDIYEALIGKGLRVFYARITLEDKLGKEYEPYIYAALYSARVMLAIGTMYEYFDAAWVKNEWARFLDMMKNDRSKTLIPCFKDIDAYDMPKEFKNLQAQDMKKLGWLQDLTRGVMKLCNKLNDNVSESERDNHISDAIEERERKLNNIRIIADRAKKNNDAITGYDSYNKLLLECPDDWEAIFYSAYFNCLQDITKEIGPIISGGIRCTCDAIRHSKMGKEDQKKAYLEMADQCVRLFSERQRSLEDNIPVPALQQTTTKGFVELIQSIIILGDEIEQFGDYPNAIKYYKTSDECYAFIDMFGELLMREPAFRVLKEKIHEKIDTAQISIVKEQDAERKRIMIQQKEKAEKEAAEKKKRIDLYWSQHSEERIEIEKRKENLEQEINLVDEKILEKKKEQSQLEEIINTTEVWADKKKKEIEKQIKDLTNRRANLGLFKIQEKKSLQTRIESLYKECPSYNDVKKEKDDLKSHYKPQMDAIQLDLDQLHLQKKRTVERIEELRNELERDR